MVSDETIVENIYDLVKALNEIRYVETFDSCEMHEMQKIGMNIGMLVLTSRQTNTGGIR